MRVNDVRFEGRAIAEWGKIFVVLNGSVIAGRSGVSYVERTAILIDESRRFGGHEYGCVTIVVAKEEGGDLIERGKQNVRNDIERREDQKKDGKLDVLHTSRHKNSNNLEYSTLKVETF